MNLPPSEPRGPVLRNSLRANAQPFTPSRGSHASQPAIRRHAQNPTFVNKTPNKRKSINGPMRKGGQVRNENNPNPSPIPHSPAQQQATSFSNDAFIKKNAAKAYAAKKRAAMRTAEQRKLDAQKGFARRQSLKAAKRSAVGASEEKLTESKSISDAVTAIDAATCEVATSVADAAMKLAEADMQTHKDHDVAPPPSPERESEIAQDPSDMISTSVTSSRPTSTSSTPSLSDSGLPTKAPVDGGILSPSVSASTITDAATEDVVPSVPSASTTSLDAIVRQETQEEKTETPILSVSTVNSTVIQPPTVQSAPAPAPSKRHSMAVLPSCSVDISAFSGTVGSSCTMSTVSGGSYSTGSRSRETPIIPSSGKWCNECAGVGLHISAMMSTMSAWRAEEERRSSNTSSSGNASSSNKGGIMRRMSQSLIGSSSAPSRSTDSNRDKERLKQQVDVLSMTVKFLHEKLQHLGAATPDVIDAVRRCM